MEDAHVVASIEMDAEVARLTLAFGWSSILINVQANREGGPGHPLSKEPRNIPAAYAGRGIIDTFEFFAQRILLADTSDGGNCWRDDGSPCVIRPLGPISTGCSFTATTSVLHASMAHFKPLTAAKVPILETPRALRVVINGFVQRTKWLHKKKWSQRLTLPSSSLVAATAPFLLAEALGLVFLLEIAAKSMVRK